MNLTFREALAKHRRIFAVLLALLAAFLTFQAGNREPVVTRSVVVATKDVPVGARLSAADLGTIELPAEAVDRLETALTSTDALIGEQLAAPLKNGMLLSRSLLMGPDLLAGMPRGTQAVTIRSKDRASTHVLSPGAEVNLIRAPSFEDGQNAPEVLTAAATVLFNSSYQEAADDAGPFGAARANADGAVLVVAVPRKVAAAVAAAAANGSILLTLSPADPDGESAD